MSCLAGSTTEPNRYGYTRCGSLEEVFAALTEHGELARPLAGGTDLVVWMQARRLEPCHLIDLSRVAELRGIEQNEDSLRLGALSTYADLLESALVKDQAPLLQQASREVGSVQIRNMGTIGGNLANASPAADLVPPLLALGAEVELGTSAGRRRVLCEDFATGPGRTVLAPGEIVVAIHIPARHEEDAGFFTKLGPRDQQAISVVSVAFHGRRVPGERRFQSIRIALGSVAPTVVRAPQAEQALSDLELDETALATACAHVQRDIAPIDDVRGSARYRRDQAVGLLRAGIEALL